MALFMSPSPTSHPTNWELGCHHRHWKGHCANGTFVAVITTRYVFDDVVADGFLAELAAALHDAGARNVVLDFRNVEAVSDTALDALAQLSGWLRKSRGQLVLCGLGEPMIEQCHLAELSGAGPWKTEADVAAALSHFAPDGSR
jgi:anti-anti-sigma regulatory factor